MRPSFRALPVLLLALPLVIAAVGVSLRAQDGDRLTVTPADLTDGLNDGSRWLTYSGDYSGRRHSPLQQITPENVKSLVPVWSFQSGTLGKFEATPLLLDGILYVTGANNFAWAIDARTGKQIWRYRREVPDRVTPCCGRVNRGFAIMGDLLFMGTLDAHVIALDRLTGAVVWDTTMADYKLGYVSTGAPLVIRDKVILGVAGGEYGIRGFIDAYDVKSGKRVWRFNTVAGPGEPGAETWSGDSWKIGGAPVWQVGSYDAEQNLVFYGTGNPGPDYDGSVREGTNLYSNSLVALNPDTGKLRWHYQFTPHDVNDWDANHVPVLGEITVAGASRKVIMVANRNGFFYTLDRITGKPIVGKPFVTTTWAKELDPRTGEPMRLANQVPTAEGTLTCPEVFGGTNHNPPSYDPALNLFFVSARERCMVYFTWKTDHEPGERHVSGGPQATADGPVNYGAIRAIDPSTGDRRWEFRYQNPSMAGVLSTASGLVFTGDGDGNFMALNSKTGADLWHFQMGSSLDSFQSGTGIYAAPTTYMLAGRQYVLLPAGTTLMSFALFAATD